MTRNVLIVEDEANIVEALSFLLSREGWGVHTHDSGDGVMGRIAETAPVLVILDVMLPVKSGLDVLAEIRGTEATRDLPVLMLTARGQIKDRDRAEEAGVNRYMTKPFSNVEVVKAVRDMVATFSAAK